MIDDKSARDSSEVTPKVTVSKTNWYNREPSEQRSNEVTPPREPEWRRIVRTSLERVDGQVEGVERTDYPHTAPKIRSLAQSHCPRCGVWCGENDRDFSCWPPGGKHEWQTHVGVTLTCSCGDEHYHRCPDALARHVGDQRVDSAKGEP